QTPHCGITAVPCISCSGTAPAGISTLSLHDALPIYAVRVAHAVKALPLQIRSARPLREAISTAGGVGFESLDASLMLTALPGTLDRKSTRLNSSHVKISYAVFCLKKKRQNMNVLP